VVDQRELRVEPGVQPQRRLVAEWNCETGVLTRHRSHGRIDIFSQVFDNSQRNSLRGVVTVALSVLPLFCAARWPAIRAQSLCAAVVLYPLTLSSGMERRVSAYRSVLFVLSAAQAHANSSSLFSAPRKRMPIHLLYPQRRASAYRSVLFVLRNSLTCAPAIA